MLNETSYHGAGAIQEIATEAKARAYKKAFVCSDPDLIKSIQTSRQILRSRMYSTDKETVRSNYRSADHVQQLRLRSTM